MQSVRRKVAVLSGTVFLVMNGISIISPALPQYGIALGATPFLAGLLVGALPASRVFVDLPAGALGDRFGNRRMMMIGLALIVVSSVLAVFAFTYWILIAVRATEGLGSAFYVTSSLAALAKSAPPERRGRYMGIYVNALLVGQVMGPVVGGAVVVAGGLRAPFAAYAGLAGIGMLLIAFGLEPEAETDASGRVRWPAVRHLLRDRSYLLVNVGTMGAFFVRSGFISTVIPLFIVYNWGVSPEVAATFAGVLLTVNALASLLTMYPSGNLADRIGRKVPFVLSLTGVGIVAPFLFYARDLASAIPVMFAYGLVLGVHGPLAAWTTDLTPNELMGTSMGLYRTFGDFGFLLGPLVTAAVLEATMVAGRVTLAPFLVVAAWVVVSAVLMAFARDPVGERRRRARAASR